MTKKGNAYIAAMMRWISCFFFLFLFSPLRAQDTGGSFLVDITIDCELINFDGTPKEYISNQLANYSIGPESEIFLHLWIDQCFFQGPQFQAVLDELDSVLTLDYGTLNLDITVMADSFPDIFSTAGMSRADYLALFLSTHVRIPPSVGKLKELTSFYIYADSLTDLPFAVSSFPKLDMLGLSGKVRDKVNGFKDVYRLPLKSISISHQQKLPFDISRFPHLFTVTVQEGKRINEIKLQFRKGRIWGKFKNLPDLKSIRFMRGDSSEYHSPGEPSELEIRNVPKLSRIKGLSTLADTVSIQMSGVNLNKVLSNWYPVKELVQLELVTGDINLLDIKNVQALLGLNRLVIHEMAVEEDTPKKLLSNMVERKLNCDRCPAQKQFIGLDEKVRSELLRYYVMEESDLGESGIRYTFRPIKKD